MRNLNFYLLRIAKHDFKVASTFKGNISLMPIVIGFERTFDFNKLFSSIEEIVIKNKGCDLLQNNSFPIFKGNHLLVGDKRVAEEIIQKFPEARLASKKRINISGNYNLN